MDVLMNRRQLLAAMGALPLAGMFGGAAFGQQKLKPAVLLSSSFNPPSLQTFYYLAGMDGIMQGQGVDLKVQQSPGSPSSIAAIVGAKAEFASVAINPAANAASEGVKIKGIAVASGDTPGMIVANPSVGSIKDLNGKFVGTAGIGTLEYSVTISYLRTKGVDHAGIRWVPTTAQANTIQGLVAGRIDAAWLDMTMAVKALQTGPNLKVLVPSREISEVAPNPTGLVMVTSKLIESDPELVQGFVTGLVLSNRKFYDDQPYFLQVAEKWLPGIYTREQLVEQYKAFQPTWGVNGGMNLVAMERTLDLWKTSMNPERANNPYFSKMEDLVDLSFLRNTLKKLGKRDGVLDRADWFTA